MHSRSREKHSTASRVFPYTSFVLYRFLRALQQNRAQYRILYLLDTEAINNTELSETLRSFLEKSEKRCTFSKKVAQLLMGYSSVKGTAYVELEIFLPFRFKNQIDCDHFYCQVLRE